jgi:hypothetical protein
MKVAKLSLLSVILSLAFAATGCGPSKADLAAKEHERLELEERARLERDAANKAITEMNKKMFRQLTPEERAQREAERARQVKALTDDFKKAEADAAAKK